MGKTNKEYLLFTIDSKGVIAKLETKPNLNSIGKEFTFKLQSENKIPDSKEELASILKL